MMDKLWKKVRVLNGFFIVEHLILWITFSAWAEPFFLATWWGTLLGIAFMFAALMSLIGVMVPKSAVYTEQWYRCEELLEEEQGRRSE